MRAKRVDENQQEIIDTLKEAGYSVHNTHDLGGGFPDIVVGCDKGNVLAEIKMPGKGLNEKETKWFMSWKGPKVVIYTKGEAVKQIEKVLEE